MSQRPLQLHAMLGNAQGVPQTVQLTKVDVIKVATGFRASKVIGSPVVNDAGDTVGRVDDVIIAEEGKAPFVVLAVGGFLGIGDKLVVLPYAQLKTMDRKIVMSGATKEALKDLPSFKVCARLTADDGPSARLVQPADARLTAGRKGHGPAGHPRSALRVGSQ